MNEDISLIPYDRIENLPSDLNLMKSQITNLQTDLSNVNSSLTDLINNQITSISSQLEILNNKIDNIKMYNYMPNYADETTISNNVEYTKPTHGWIIGYDEYPATGGGGRVYIYVYVNNNWKNLRISEMQDDYSYNSYSYPIPANTKFKISWNLSNDRCGFKYYPCIGS